jgi:putative membrane-bound dehydrogenase-like protein
MTLFQTLLRCFWFTSLLAGLGAVALGQERPEPLAARPLPPTSPPRTPQEEQGTFQLADGLRIELVACEPAIQSPVAMSFDERGRLWVVEMPDYPNGPPPGQEPQGRIKVLTDRDGDGFYETAHIFADKLLFANGLLLWRDGVFVTQAPYLLYLRDTDGDGRADRREVWYRGFAAENPQLRVCFPTLGLDGWVYCANGLRGGQVVREQAGKATGPVVSLNGRDFRFNPRHPEHYEAISGPGQYGLTFDDWGERFVCDNRHHLRHVVLETRYLQRNPALAAPAVLYDISVLDREPLPAGAGGRIYPISRNFTTSPLHAGHFSAACGLFLYRGDLLQSYSGLVFTCDPSGNLVHGERLTPEGATFLARPLFSRREFLASTDDWFRPVFLTSGPDGALYVVDMYRAVIEHPEYMPPELRQRPDLTWGKERGRIWRIVPAARPPRQAAPVEFAARSPEELLPLLAHPNGWHRDTARRLLWERLEPSLAPQLRQLARTSPSPQARAAALWLLAGIKALDDETLRQNVLHPCAGLAQQAVILAATCTPTAELQAALQTAAHRWLAAPPHAGTDRALFYLALTLGETNAPQKQDWLARILVARPADPWMRLAVLSSCREEVAELFTQVVRQLAEASSAREASGDLLRELAVVLGSQPALEKATRAICQIFTSTPALSEDQRAAILLGFAEGLSRQGRTLSAWLADQEAVAPAAAHALRQVLLRAADQAQQSQASVAQRLRAIQLLGQAPWPLAGPVLTALWQREPHPQLRLALVRALDASSSPQAADLLLSGWPAASPSLRREILEALLRRPERTAALLTALEKGQVAAAELDPLRVQQLRQHPDAALRQRAHRVLQSPAGDRQAVLDRYRLALTLPAQARRGREVFRKHCASCHVVAGLGTPVGPDISDMRNKVPEQLLRDILDPNAAIDGNYITYLVTTRDGKTYTGLLATETPTAIVLKRAENQQDTILRSEIEDIRSTGRSLMPEGLEKELSPQALADLIAFLKNWRYEEVAEADPAKEPSARLRIEERPEAVLIDTDQLQARINKKGYVSGVAAGSFLDKKTGARDVGFGLHIMDFLLAPGWREDGYVRDPRIHGHLPKHLVEGPQICTQAKELPIEILRGKDFIAVRLRYTFTQPGRGYKAGSRWQQTLLFQPGKRYFISAEEITCVNTLDNLSYRIDMPGHIRHQQGDSFVQIYLSYQGLIPAREFLKDFGPDERFYYRRQEDKVPERLIRAYQVRLPDGKAGPWLAGMTLDPAVVSEAWCHQRGYVCFIEELHGRPVRAGQTIGAAYVVGWFDSLPEMQQLYDRYRGKRRLVVDATGWQLK